MAAPATGPLKGTQQQIGLSGKVNSRSRSKVNRYCTGCKISRRHPGENGNAGIAGAGNRCRQFQSCAG